MTLAYFASRSRLDLEASLAAAADAAGGDRNYSWGTPGTSQPSAYLRGAGFSAAAVPDTKTSLLCNHADARSPCTKRKTIYAHALEPIYVEDWSYLWLNAVYRWNILLCQFALTILICSQHFSKPTRKHTNKNIIEFSFTLLWCFLWSGFTFSSCFCQVALNSIMPLKDLACFVSAKWIRW